MVEVLSKDDRHRRVAAVEMTLRRKVHPAGVWPRPFYGGDLTDCDIYGFTGIILSPPYVTFEGTEQRPIKLLIEAASGLALPAGWTLRPFDCGERSCLNPHHWRVVRYSGSPSPELPEGRGFKEIGDGEFERVKKLVASEKDGLTMPPHVFHRYHRDCMFELIVRAQKSDL